MSVYVDEITEYAPEQIRDAQARRAGRRWSHMWCDGDVEELHRMAAAIGMKRAWFQDGRLKHYDVVPSKRALAIAKGAKVMSLRQYLRNERDKPRTPPSQKNGGRG